MEEVHETFRLHITADKFFIEPTDEVINEFLVIDRVSREITLQKNEDQIPSNAEVKPIYGIFGIIRLVAGPYLIVITKRKKVGQISGHTIWQVAGTEVLSYSKTLFHITEKQAQANARYLSMVTHMLGLESYYYSTTYDVTHTLQRLHNTSPEFIQMPLYERADPRFVWNGHLLRELTQQPELSRYCLPLMLGFIEITPCSIHGKAFTYTLVSRRSCLRAGTRYYMRGIDSEGHPANFVETEQITQTERARASFVQTRGSIPLYWNQYPNLKYKPTPVIHTNLVQQQDGFNKHFAAQLYNYGKQVVISLLDHKGSEIGLVKNLGHMVQEAKNESIRLEAFDFHHECRKMRWDRLSILTDKLDAEQKSFKYFLETAGGSALTLQEGVFRTNCIDCLDRTNVVQSLLARKNLQDFFEKEGILASGQRVEDQAVFESTFKNVWADNADGLAKQYAGTGALKTDFTRTGKRTITGALKDGYNSAIRYVLNNFYDGYRQDSIDLLLGNYVVEETEGATGLSPLLSTRDWKFVALPVILVIAFAMCLISILVPDEHLSEQVMFLLFWGGACLVTGAIIYRLGEEFVDKPRLAQIKIKVE